MEARLGGAIAGQEGSCQALSWKERGCFALFSTHKHRTPEDTSLLYVSFQRGSYCLTFISLQGLNFLREVSQLPHMFCKDREQSDRLHEDVCENHSKMSLKCESSTLGIILNKYIVYIWISISIAVIIENIQDGLSAAVNQVRGVGHFLIRQTGLLCLQPTCSLTFLPGSDLNFKHSHSCFLF